MDNDGTFKFIIKLLLVIGFIGMLCVTMLAGVLTQWKEIIHRILEYFDMKIVIQTRQNNTIMNDTVIQ
jgi:hypothetical protein